MGPELQHMFGVLTIAGGESVKVTGPEGKMARAAPFESEASVLKALLVSNPGASGAFQRIETPVRFSPNTVFTEIETEERILRVPARIVIGMYSELSVAPFIDFAYVYSVAVDDSKALTGATTLPDCDWQLLQVRIHASADRSPEGNRKYSFCNAESLLKNTLSGFAITATGVNLVAIL
jgi:hypothetical protein